jgi:hypothetical protein
MFPRRKDYYFQILPNQLAKEESMGSLQIHQRFLPVQLRKLFEKKEFNLFFRTFDGFFVGK